MPAIFATVEAKKYLKVNKGKTAYSQPEKTRYILIGIDHETVFASFQLMHCRYSPIYDVWEAMVSSQYYNEDVGEWCSVGGIYEAATLEDLSEQLVAEYGVQVIFG